MTHLPSLKRLVSVAQAGAFIAAMLSPLAAHAQENQTVYELRPHCDNFEQELENGFGGPVPNLPGVMVPTTGGCQEYRIADPEHRETDTLKKDDVLDMDLIIVNAPDQSISRIRAWIAYDPTIFEGVSVEIDPAFSIPTPGEDGFDTENGLIKIGASTDKPVTDRLIRVARIKLKVVSPTADSTVLSFDDLSGTPDSHTAVIVPVGTEDEMNVLPATLGSLIVNLERGAGATSSAAVTSSAGVSSGGLQGAPVSSAGGNSQEQTSSAAEQSAGSEAAQTSSTATTFTLLQLQNLRATTEGSAVFLAWDTLPSADVKGYNVYYGTTSGKYIQRRSIDASANTLTIRGLMEGTTYFFAVRALNGKNQETQFSREVSIMVGRPETSTAPLAASAIQSGPGGKAPATGGTISGESGTNSALVLLFGACAVIGTVLAFRRQFVANTIHG